MRVVPRIFRPLGTTLFFLYSEIVNEGGTAIRHRPFLGAIFYFIVGDFANMMFWEKGGRAGDMPQSPERGAI